MKMKTFSHFRDYLNEDKNRFLKDMKYFQKEVTKHDFTSDYFDNSSFKVTDFGFTYVFDGSVDGAVVYENGLLYDLGDTDHKKLKTPEGRKAELKNSTVKFRNIKELTKNFIQSLDPDKM